MWSYENDSSLPVLDKYSHSSNITPYLILNAFKTLTKSTAAEIAAQFNISDSTARLIFKRYVDLPRLPLPEYISIDEVYLDISNTENMHLSLWIFLQDKSLISSTIVGILLLKVTSYPSPLKERLNVKGVISDAYKAYLTMPEEFFLMRSQLDSFMVKAHYFSNRCLYHLVVKGIQERDRS